MAVTSVSNQMTIQQIIDETSKTSSSRNTGELGKDDFLNLLVTQLRYQDPLKPMDDKEFIAQMAQFSSLEQMQNLNSTFASSQAFSLIGKRVTANIAESGTGDLQEVIGTVTNVKLDRGKAYVVVQGKDIPVESILNVADANAFSDSNISAFTGLIGFNTDAVIYDPETGDMIQVSGVVRAIRKGLYEDYAALENVTLEISEVITNEPSADPDFISKELEYAKENHTDIDLMVVDRSTGKKVPITAKVSDYEIKDGKITVTVEELLVPLEGISSITPAPAGQQTEPEENSSGDQE